MVRSASAVTATLAITMEARAAGCLRAEASSSFMGCGSETRLDFDMGAQFHHAVRRDVEEVGGARGVTGHPGEEMVAPERHARRVAGGNHGLARQEERRVHHV